MFASYISDYVFERKYCHFFLDTAAAIPPAISPTAVAAMPKPITPSAMKKKKVSLFYQSQDQSDFLLHREENAVQKLLSRS